MGCLRWWGVGLAAGLMACGGSGSSGSGGGSGAASAGGATSSGGSSGAGAASAGGSAGNGTSGAGNAGGSSAGQGGMAGVGGSAGAGGSGGSGGFGASGGAPSDLPVGIPAPAFGCDVASGASATLWVDNTNPNCDDSEGTEAAPLCDLFRGGNSATFEAGDVVHVLGGPYPVSGDYTLTFNGTQQAPVLILGQGSERVRFDGEGSRANFAYEGSYAQLENLDFFHRTQQRLIGDHLAFCDVGVHNPADAFIEWNPVVSLQGHDLVIAGSDIFNNRRTNDTDSHGINAGEGSFNLWILDNEIYNNNGDAFQGCHMCTGSPPHHVYIGRNVLHEDRENGVDLKTIADVVISENEMYGYGSSTTSNGDAMVIGSNGFDDGANVGPRRVWVVNNHFHDSSTGVRVEGSEDVWIVGNVFEALSTGLQIDQKSHRSIVVAANTISEIQTDGVSVFGCEPSELVLLNNLVVDAGERHLDMRECAAARLTLNNNLFWNDGDTFAVRADGATWDLLSELSSQPFASGNISADPSFEAGTVVPAAGSPAIDAGTSLQDIYDAFEAAFGVSIAADASGTARPAGDGADVGAYEQ